MNKIKEDYVSYKIAELLKEKGFDEPCRSVYEEKILRIDTVCDYFNSELSSYVCAPTLQMAMKWLREVYGIDIIIEISDPLVKDRKYYCMIWDSNNNSYILDLFNSYEEACEESLKYCLMNLIK